MATFTPSDIQSSFEPAICERGLRYFKQGNVLDAWKDGRGDLRAVVSGSEWEPYRVRIVLIARKGWTKLQTDCTCPYEDQCKHGVAAAYYILKNGYRTLPSDEADPEEEDYEDEDEDDYEEEAEEQPEVEFVLPQAAPSVRLDVPLPNEIEEWLRGVESALVDHQTTEPEASQRLYYRLKLKQNPWGGYGLILTLVSRNLLKTGALGGMTAVKSGTINAWQKPKYWTQSDIDLVKDLEVNSSGDRQRHEYGFEGRHGERLLEEVFATGRAIWDDGQPISLGAPRSGVFEWEETGKKGMVAPRIRLEGRATAVILAKPWYIDIATREFGRVDCGFSPELAIALLRRGPIAPEHLGSVRTSLERLGVPEQGMPSAAANVVVRAPDPVPCLSIDFEVCGMRPAYWSTARAEAPIAFAKLTFEYEGIRAPVDGSDIRSVVGDEIHLLRRNPRAEENAREALLRWGWRETTYTGWEIPKGRGTSLCIIPLDPYSLTGPLERVQLFAEKVVPVLTAAGWRVEIDKQFRFVPESEVEWDVALEEGSGIDWFQFRLGIRVEGEPFDLRPILAQAIKEQAARPETDDLFAFGLNGRAIRFSRKRLNALVQPLLELFGGLTEWPAELRLPKASLPELEKLHERAAAERIQWKTSTELARLTRLFKTFDHLEPCPEPPGFTGQLREYQKEGLAWLQFLREYDFGGVLADDMGLGKTVQVLAHIQTEKTAGRMDRPCLIVAPTSTIPNWRRECERFAPDLKVVTLRGGRRADRFTELETADVALTTYPLLARDREHLAKAKYHLLVLDEAQNIKNPITAAAKAARELEARHRICLSGTPVENHLSELWSLFNFLMPGFLGIDTDFRKRYRVPIEKQADSDARERLARRIRPFMLRRTKKQVVQELPPKTEVVETIEFEDPQRDLYESIRVAMDEQVRNLIASQGFEKSRIQVLDALLKLRQVCCDPRLVKLESAKKVSASAKLDRLMEMLGILLQDGRRILLFSQFTSMLDLIEERLKADGLTWVRISGNTEDRDTPVRRFQAGEVPLFLISLKAGGTGLNLTAADTVILYDPWWNPAVENQAIDRAHRIGQENPVIVYKMVASGTIEEKMLEMQARKGDIARSILTDDAEGIRPLTADDLRWMLSKD